MSGAVSTLHRSSAKLGRQACTVAACTKVMRYWDEDDPEWTAAKRDYADAWRSRPIWVVSRTLKSVGPNATLVTENFETVIQRLRAEVDGEIEVLG